MAPSMINPIEIAKLPSFAPIDKHSAFPYTESCHVIDPAPSSSISIHMALFRPRVKEKKKCVPLSFG